MRKIKLAIEEINRDSAIIHEKSKKPVWMIKFDMVYCMLRYGASPENYYKFEFYNLSANKRRTYVTYQVSQQMIMKYNNPKCIDVFEDKLRFAREFNDMFCREYLDTEKMDFNSFKRLAMGGTLICKPIDGAQGGGIVVYHAENKNEEELREMFEEVEHRKRCILEAWIMQHPVLNDIYPKAVNCLRIITVYDGKEAHFLTGGVTFGISDEIANGSLPSIIAPVDLETGKINKPAATYGSELYEKHPTTGKQILGIQLPYWMEIKELLQKAAARCPQCGYIGWDIAITPDGPILIEGNTTPGYKYYQIPLHHPDGIGNRAIYEQFL